MFLRVNPEGKVLKMGSPWTSLPYFHRPELYDIISLFKELPWLSPGHNSTGYVPTRASAPIMSVTHHMCLPWSLEDTTQGQLCQFEHISNKHRVTSNGETSIWLLYFTFPVSPDISCLLFESEPTPAWILSSESVCVGVCQYVTLTKGFAFPRKHYGGKNGILYRNLKQSFPRDEVTDPNWPQGTQITN